jgi:hypothetical protein
MHKSPCKNIDELMCRVAADYAHCKSGPDIVEKKEELLNAARMQYKRIPGILFTIATWIPDFIIKKDGLYYHFQPALAGIDMKENIPDNTASFSGPPWIINTPYNHPLVWNDGEVEYGGSERWQRLGISFNHFYTLDNAFARRAVLAIRECRMALETCYTGENGRPVHQFSDFKPAANKRFSALNYASMKGIPSHRIMENGQKCNLKES